jgi:maltose alpha-D-glucosyltransferase / alpha-amylase
MKTMRQNSKLLVPPQDPLWYKKAIIYQAHVRSFADSDANGIGDFRGLTAKLGYLEDLGVTAIWLLPFYPSPLRDDGYDIADYYSINPIYGTLADFKTFLKEAHGRGLRVITELVVNHTSDQHSWFQKSRRGKRGSRWRDFYVWSDTPDLYKEARIIFKDFEPSNWSWDAMANAYFWHRFYSHQPDLNYENLEVHNEILRVLDFWLDMGVDGLRLDAVPYLYERDGTNCENLPETHAFLKKLRAHMDEKYGDRMLLAEANQWPEDSVAYFGQGKGDECHVAFHFPLMPRLFMSVRLEDRTPILDILEQTPAIPETSQWAIFLRNHDELTLEMVTDEERDYMYRVYAQDARARINLGIRRRLAPLLGNDRKRIELLNALLLSMPGTPVIYYGDEVGMGDNIFLGDRNGVRTPMQWSSDKNAGFSRANPQSLFLPVILDPEYHYEAINVEAQDGNPHSLLRWMKRLLALRKRWKAFGLGSMEFLQPENRKILAFIRRYENECILVVCNLSRFSQPLELDLSAFQQLVPVELFGRTAFPPITNRPYFLTLGPHAFCWFALMPRFTDTTLSAKPPPDRAQIECGDFEVEESWETIVEENGSQLEECLRKYIQPRRWFGAKARELNNVVVRETITVPARGGKYFLLFLDVDYLQGDPETYLLPIAFQSGSEAERIIRETPHQVVARVRLAKRGIQGILYDAAANPDFAGVLLDSIGRRRALKGNQGEVQGFALPSFRQLRGDPAEPLAPHLGRAEQSNSTIIYGDKFILKLYRRIESGENPDLEINRFLAERDFKHVPALLGGLQYAPSGAASTDLAILMAFVPNCRDAWQYTLDALGRYYDRISSLPEEHRQPPRIEGNMVDAADREVPALIQERMGTYTDAARLLGERTAALHLCLASDSENKNFAPEPFTPFYQRGLFQSMRNQAVQVLSALRKRVATLPESVRADAERIVSAEGEILKRLRAITETRIAGMRLRIHGDYHLGQVLHTGKDFLIIDFEGQPGRPLGERRIKRTPLRDIAGMLRSFHYAAYAALYNQVEHGVIGRENAAWLDGWARFWTRSASVIFLKAYLEGARKGQFLPATNAEIKILLDTNVITNAIYEVGYELNSRPTWLRIPIHGVLQLLE